MFNVSRFNRKTALGLVKRLTGYRGWGVVSSPISNVSTPVLKIASDINASNTAIIVMNADAQPDPTPYADNDDPWRVRFRKMGMSRMKQRLRKLYSLLVTFFAYIAELLSPRYSFDERMTMITRASRWKPEDLAAHRDEKEKQRIFLFHKQQARLIQNRIIEKLTQLRFCHHTLKNDQVRIRRRIQVAYTEVSAYAYVYTLGFPPFGVKYTDLAEEWVTNELCATVNKKVRIEMDMWGTRITVEVGSTLSIPNLVLFKDMVDKFPKTAAPLTFIGGMGTNGSPTYRNLADAPHMIIAGSTGGGKSNQQNVVICSLILRNDPRVLKCVFFDLKGGVEFAFYEGIPHLLPMTNKDDWKSDGIIERKHDVIPALKWLSNECEQRLKKIKAAKVKNIAEYNRGKRIDKKMPSILVVIDEWAIIRKSEFGKEAMTILGELGNISRSTGFNIVLCTQYPNAEILDPTIAVNFDWRFAFAMTTGASQSVLGGSWDAYGLNPVGRAIFHTNEGNMQVQTPLITNGNIEAIVQGLKTGSTDVAGMMGVDVSEILEWALNYTSGELAHDTLFNQFREKISQNNLRSLLRSMDNKIFDVNGTFYKVVNERGGNRARHMELATETAPSDENSTFHTPLSTETPENAQNEAVLPQEPDVESISAQTCEKCGGNTDEDPCEYCRSDIETETEKENAR